MIIQDGENHVNVKKPDDAREYFSEFCNNTSLHGMKYVGGEKRTCLEKCLWTFLFISAVTICGTMIYKAYIDWRNNPVIVSFSDEPTLVWEIPFPAVTVCPQVKVQKSVYDFSKNFTKQIASNEITMNKYLYVCDAMPYMLREEIDILKNETFDGNENTSVDDFIKVVPTLDDFINDCEWNLEQINCSDLFKPVLTEEGICYNFNMLANDEIFKNNVVIHKHFESGTEKSNWNLENGYTKQSNSYPRRVYTPGIKSGLMFWLTTNLNEYNELCSLPVFGHKIMLHSPGDIPRSTTRYITAPINEEVSIAVTPDYFKTANELKTYSVYDRKCYFEDEKTLMFFKKYSQQNCELECIANYTLSKCGCVPFYMPREESTMICNEQTFVCTKDAERGLVNTIMRGDDENEIPCDCKPSCFSLQYKEETSQAPYDWKKWAEGLNMYNENGEENIVDVKAVEMTTVKISMNSLQFASIERKELNSIIDLLANWGGLLGLFTGFSVLSLMEIVYYFTARSWINKSILGKFFIPTPENTQAFDKTC